MKSAVREDQFERWAEDGAAWSGHRVTTARAWLAERTDWPAVCARCGGDVQPWGWHLGHVRDRQANPQLTWVPGNWRVEHRRCSQRAGAAQGNSRRKNAKRLSDPVVAGTPDLPRFVSEKLRIVTDRGPVARELPATLSERPRTPGDHDGLPAYFSAPHPEAVGSLGDEYVRAAEERRGEPLRWWQWLTAQRRYEVRADGSWCWLLVLTSVSRQQGKSVELCEDAAWMGGRGLGMEMLHAAHRVTTSRTVQADLWSWAERAGYEVARQLGDSRITWPDGSVWGTVAMESAYGRRPERLLADEAWAMDPDGFWNSMYPALGDKTNPQVLFWSAANAADKGLVADLRKDDTVCRMEWGALPGEDHADPRVWRASTAYWRPERERLMAKAVDRPGFAENWLNVWPEPADAKRWLSKAATDRAALLARLPRRAPDGAVCAVECSLDGQRWAVATAWTDRRGPAVRVQLADDLEQCLGLVAGRPLRGHQAVIERIPQHARYWAEPVNQSQHRAATGELRDLVRGGSVRVAGIPDEQWAAVRTGHADGGQIIDAKRSTGDVHAVKAAAWAVWAVLSGYGQPGLVM